MLEGPKQLNNFNNLSAADKGNIFVLIKSKGQLAFET
jgi:hypothetical protein